MFIEKEISVQLNKLLKELYVTLLTTRDFFMKNL